MTQTGDPVDLDPRREFELVARNRRADGHTNEIGVHPEVLQRGLEHLAALLNGAGVERLRRAALQQVARRQGPVSVSVAREVDRHLTLGVLVDGHHNRLRPRRDLDLVRGVDDELRDKRLFFVFFVLFFVLCLELFVLFVRFLFVFSLDKVELGLLVRDRLDGLAPRGQGAPRGGVAVLLIVVEDLVRGHPAEFEPVDNSITRPRQT